MVINLNTEEQEAAYAIFADLGPYKIKILNINEEAHRCFQDWGG